MNLIKKINVNELIGKTINTNYYKEETFTIIAADKLFENNDISLLLVNLEDAQKDETHLNQMESMLKEINKSMKNFLKQDFSNLEEKFWRLRFFTITIKNPLMRNGEKNSLESDFYNVKFCMDKNLIDEYATVDYNALSLEELEFSELQKEFIKLFTNILGKEYVEQFINFYCEIVEKNIKSKEIQIFKKIQKLNESRNKINDIKKEVNNNHQEVLENLF